MWRHGNTTQHSPVAYPNMSKTFGALPTSLFSGRSGTRQASQRSVVFVWSMLPGSSYAGTRLVHCLSCMGSGIVSTGHRVFYSSPPRKSAEVRTLVALSTL